MVDVTDGRCSHEGCNKRPAYGVTDSTEGNFCSEHEKYGMVNIRAGGVRTRVAQGS